MDESFIRSIEQRLKQYHLWEKRALEKAELMPSLDLRRGWLKVAGDWKALAEEIERKLRLSKTPNGCDL
jgi:hypothetical protein